MAGTRVIPSTVAAALSEEDFQQQVIDFATMTGWRHFHARDMRGSDAGWPDLVLCRPPELVVIELKRERGRITDSQREWLQALELCGLEVHVYRPSDWPEIENRLKR